MKSVGFIKNYFIKTIGISMPLFNFMSLFNLKCMQNIVYAASLNLTDVKSMSVKNTSIFDCYDD